MEELTSWKQIIQHKISFTWQHTFIVLLLVAVSIWLCKYLWNRRKLYLYSLKVPGPLNLPFIGAAYLFLGNSNDALLTVTKLLDKWPRLCKLWIGPRLIYFVKDPHDIKKVLNSPYAIEKDDIMYESLIQILGEGVLTAPGLTIELGTHLDLTSFVVKDNNHGVYHTIELGSYLTFMFLMGYLISQLNSKVWKIHRKKIAPSFNKKMLDSFVNVFAEKSEIFAKQIIKVNDDENVDWYILATRCTLDIICETAMGVNMNIQINADQEMGKYIENLLHIANYKLLHFWYHIPIVWNLSSLKKDLWDNIGKFWDITSLVVETKMKKYNEEKIMLRDGLSAEIDEDLKRHAILDILLENSDFTENEIKDEINTFLAAGTETTAASLCNLFTCLAMFPDIQQKVYEEIFDIIGPDRTVEANDLSMMKYTERVIKESLRLLPIAAVFARKLTGEISLGDVILPAGSSVAFANVSIHRNPRYWKDPSVFNPNRFLPEESAKRHPCAYLPFSFGPRNCIGSRYAILNLKTILATVIRQYEIHTKYRSLEDIELEVQLLLRIKNGYKLSFKPR